MIRRIVNRGFKDQDRTTELTGLDLFTSDNVNGVGKSAVLEAFKLGLLGEIPGKAKTLEDLLQFTSLTEMAVEIVAGPSRSGAFPGGVGSGVTPAGQVTVERRFLREAAGRNERRPIRINGAVKKYEEGDRWVRATLGAVSLSFDPFEFLNLSDRKKRQWIIAHSPESAGLNRTALEALLTGRMVEALFGSGLAREQELCLGFDRNPSGEAERLKSRLVEVSRRLDRPLAERVETAMGRAFSPWDVSLSAEENIAVILGHLKSEILRLKDALRDRRNANPPAPLYKGEASSASASAGRRSAVADRLDPDGERASSRAIEARPSRSGAFPGASPDGALAARLEEGRNKIRSLDGEIGELAARMERSRQRAAQRDRREARTKFLRETMDALTRKLEDDRADAFRGRIAELNASLEDLRPLQEELDRLNGGLRERSEDCRRREERLTALEEELKSKRGRVNTLRAERTEDFRCPLAAEIRCETDMEPHLGLLAGEIETLEECAEAEKLSLESAREGLRTCAHNASGARDRVAKLSRRNETVHREIESLQEKLFAGEKETSRARGALKAYREEIESFSHEAVADDGEDIGELEEEMRRRQEAKRSAGEELAQLLREQGRADILRELAREREELEKELKIAVLMSGLLGPDGIQGELAAQVGSALEDEVNEVLRLIDPGYEFFMDLSGDRISMGWNRSGKLIPLATINSAHFIFFAVPFLTALLGRLARAREKEGLPTLKALCIEAESMTPGNLAVLLRGLSIMKAKGRLDNALVAHYASLRDPGKLSGFKEHILSAPGTPTRRGGRGGDDAGAIAGTPFPPPRQREAALPPGARI